MSRFHSYIQTARQMLAEYSGSLPFAPYAKAFFAKEKKYGSTDRRQISALCYNYFRAGKALGNMPDEGTMLNATFLCETTSSQLLEALRPEWNANIHLSLQEKIDLAGLPFDKEQLFPFKNEISNQLSQEEFSLSFLIQPSLYLRVRPGYKKTVLQKLEAKNFPVTEIGESCLSLPNGSKVEEVITPNKEAVVQDWSSQQTGDVMKQFALDYLPHINSWDCCAASGGKSLMLHDLRRDANLTVSDIRSSILHNLQQRFALAGIKNYQHFVADVSTENFLLPGKKSFNLVMADVPCTGSGTWARTPEQMYYFKTEKIQEYATRQRKIVHNVLPFLQSGGYLVYITCSVFTQENEAIVQSLLQQNNLQLLTQQYLKGYDKKADTLFIAILKKG